MSSRTTNYNLIKPDITEKALIGDINNNMDTIDTALAAKANSTELSSVEDGLAILANGNTHAAIASEQAVFVRGHSSLANGLYWAKAAIAQNAALSTSNLTADSAGGLNALKADVDALNSNFMTPVKINPTIENTNISIADNGSFRIGRMAFIAMRLQITGDVPAAQVVMTGFPVLYESTLGSGASAIGIASSKKTFTMSAYGQLMTGESLSASDTTIVINCAYVCQIH